MTLAVYRTGNAPAGGRTLAGEAGATDNPPVCVDLQ